MNGHSQSECKSRPRGGRDGGRSDVDRGRRCVYRGMLVYVVKSIPAAPVVHFVLAVPAAGWSETQTVRGFLVQASMLLPNAPSMSWTDLKRFVRCRLPA